MLINKLPTVFEIVSGRVKAPSLPGSRKPKAPRPASAVSTASLRPCFVFSKTPPREARSAFHDVRVLASEIRNRSESSFPPTSRLRPTTSPRKRRAARATPARSAAGGRRGGACHGAPTSISTLIPSRGLTPRLTLNPRRLYKAEEFWIACDFCDTWYCGRCAKMTEAKAQKVKNWKCSGCTGE